MSIVISAVLVLLPLSLKPNLRVITKQLQLMCLKLEALYPQCNLISKKIENADILKAVWNVRARLNGLVVIRPAMMCIRMKISII